MKAFIEIDNPTEYTKIFTSPTLFLKNEETKKNKIYNITKIIEMELYNDKTAKFEKTWEKTEEILTTTDKDLFINTIHNLRGDFSFKMKTLDKIEIKDNKVKMTRVTSEYKNIETLIFSEK